MGSSSSSFRASPGSPVAGTELGSKQASPSAGMIDDDDNIDGGQQKHRQLPDLPAAGADHFSAAQLLYNLSAIHARRYEYADAKLLLVQATEEMRVYVTAVQQERVNVNTIHMMAKADSEGYEKFLQQFLDPWNPVPACMTVDAMTGTPTDSLRRLCAIFVSVLCTIYLLLISLYGLYTLYFVL